MRASPGPDLVLSGDERAQLQDLTLRRTTSQAIAQRARIVLARARGLTPVEIALWEHVTPTTVAKWIARFVAGRLAGLHDAPRSGAPRSLHEVQVRAVLAKTLHALPPDGTTWSTRAMAAACGVSQSAVSRIWRAHGLQPGDRTANVSSTPSRPRQSAARNKKLPTNF
jgi:transposase